MKNEFGEVIRDSGFMADGLVGKNDKVGVDCATQTEQEARREVTWESCFIFLFSEKPTPKEMLYPNKSVRVKRAMVMAVEVIQKLQIESYLNKK